jgi:hypothetical protein
MSDHWETFPCQMGEHAAWISYDHGLRNELDRLPFANCARFAVTLIQPDDRGLPHGGEFEKLNAIEDQLLEEIPSTVGIQIGRVTTNGKRFFFFFTLLDDDAVANIAEKLASAYQYKISYAHEADPERSCYWNDLFPTANDWQVIQDIRVQEALRNDGDNLTTPRPIEHWAYFKTEADRDRFVATVGSRFDACDLYETPDSDEGKYTAKLKHTGLPDYRSMNSVTILLSNTARECNGDYDGWETEVCRN